MFAEDMTPLQTEETKIVVTENQTQPQNAQAVTAGTAFKKPTVEEMQKALQNAGFYRGKIDGKSGPMTKKAIEEFQAQNGLKADGKAGPKTWGKLKPYLAGTAVKK
ncbi:MAG: peptidoglycan-binding protein [Candidatus Omnitrophica bacterium]|nr:peptidoglycan-binding protein [Candidatus Omnitrophota bacterium]